MSDFLSPRQVAAQWFQRLWNEHDRSVIADLLAPDSRAELEGGQVVIGPDGFAPFYDTLLDTFPDIRARVLDIAEEGDRAYIRWEACGTHCGSALGIAPTKCAHSFRGITWIRVKDGKVIAGGDCWNQAGLLQRMAAESPHP